MSTPASAPVSGGRLDAAAGTGPAPQFDSGGAWTLNPKVALRPEPFGALLYHFGTRKLSFLKNLTVVDIVSSLGDHASASDALAAAGIGEADRALYVQALGALADSGMIVPRPAA
ncbi:mycofactocin biosynthesis chaperone MftB [Gordonia sp. SL306]|uniref:mycofactocin biosynthesis chaperone MftB n=1 Tax=Gordonia sp. SL306 TaxID=2995145 RepID=UPI0022712A53|nr:mycofactocin biosynthesis chaperone MftB [Gordonia sp. SL306]WAC56541.1 mycofactocin biosynthesis chaperone MftB [Gordonia sp. SL306]